MTNTLARTRDEVSGRRDLQSEARKKTQPGVRQYREQKSETEGTTGLKGGGRAYRI